MNIWIIEHSCVTLNRIVNRKWITIHIFCHIFEVYRVILKNTKEIAVCSFIQVFLNNSFVLFFFHFTCSLVPWGSLETHWGNIFNMKKIERLRLSCDYYLTFLALCTMHYIYYKWNLFFALYSLHWILWFELYHMTCMLCIEVFALFHMLCIIFSIFGIL